MRFALAEGVAGVTGADVTPVIDAPTNVGLPGKFGCC